MRGDEAATALAIRARETDLCLPLASPDHVRGRRATDNVFCVRPVDLVAMPGVPHPIPFRTRSLSPPGPMVLRLKARESRSPPGPPKGCTPPPPNTFGGLTLPLRCHRRFAAGWSSPVARQAHNLKVVGSNPTPATNTKSAPATAGAFLRLGPAWLSAARSPPGIPPSSARRSAR